MIEVPRFEPNLKQREHIRHHRETARIIRELWSAASPKIRSDVGFLAALMRATWVGSHEHSDAARLTRNRYWGRWLGVLDWRDEHKLADALQRKLPALSGARSRRIVGTHTGMTLYYTAVRPNTISFLKRHRKAIAGAATRVAAVEPHAVQKVRTIARILEALPRIRMPRGGQIPCFSGLTPFLACLDPQRRFPIMNAQTTWLLGILRANEDADGAAALAELIGKHDIADSFSLDVYGYSNEARIKRALRAIRRGRSAIVPPNPRHSNTLGRDGLAILAKRQLRVRRLHNRLTNRFRKAIGWYHDLKQSRVDILIERWNGNRWLIVEAKTATSGNAGAWQLRQAIGQLFDYRLIYFPKTWRRVDLALLTPSEPPRHVLDLLRTLKIEAIWFRRNKLGGTIKLVP
jgi:hypothetical protein